MAMLDMVETQPENSTAQNVSQITVHNLKFKNYLKMWFKVRSRNFRADFQAKLFRFPMGSFLKCTRYFDGMEKNLSDNYQAQMQSILPKTNFQSKIVN
jgi:hypothetical protein